jgi:hypothetical protein
MKIEHGNDVFQSGCPVCEAKCCCSDKIENCPRKVSVYIILLKCLTFPFMILPLLVKFHCYKKCPISKRSIGKPSKAFIAYFL